MSSHQNSEGIYSHGFLTPIGKLCGLVDRTGRVMSLGYSFPPSGTLDSAVEPNKYACGELEYQIEEYFAGTRSAFSLDIRVEGTVFQKTVWNRLGKIEYGETATYSEVAQKIGRRHAARAVGGAVAANPIMIIIPCHRVIPSDRGIGNYLVRSVGLEEGRRIKRFLLEFETGQKSLVE